MSQMLVSRRNHVLIESKLLLELRTDILEADTRVSIDIMEMEGYYALPRRRSGQT